MGTVGGEERPAEILTRGVDGEWSSAVSGRVLPGPRGARGEAVRRPGSGGEAGLGMEHLSLPSSGFWGNRWARAGQCGVRGEEWVKSPLH